MELIKEKAQLRKQIVLGRGGEVSPADHERLRELRKAVNKALKEDKNLHLEEMAADVMKNFNRSGTLRKAYLGVKRLAGVGVKAAASMLSVDVDRFQEHFRQLLGAGGTTIPNEIKGKRAWRLAHEWLADKSKYETPWAVSDDPPTREEFGKATDSCRDNKGVSQENIPTELWKHSEVARELLWKLVVLVWERMKTNKPGDELDIPEDWVTACLVCLYRRGKGTVATQPCTGA